MIRPSLVARILGIVFLAAVSAVPVCAREAGLPASGMAQQTLRPYWHVFIAYAVTIALVLGWVMSISRRLKDVEDRLKE